MPHWLKKQLKNAYLQKDRYQIRLLNQCWFYYKRRQHPESKKTC
ncbi:cortex morphogenetic protein CmpA [Desertibacillus haloalkaliphilus]|nr:cortex morphogenetic protein CmpA [Desertibacillus haloalkaliphilus]MBU8908754.1 cortex morphogenetic protein CmpA [Desertibacillus haloalkaliphilus]